MFAVPGWSVDSSALKTQTATGATAESTKSRPDHPKKENSKKRKRGGDQDVTKDNLADVWEKVIEGKSEKKHKKGKGGHGGKTDEETKADVVENETTREKNSVAEGQDVDKTSTKKKKKHKDKKIGIEEDGGIDATSTVASITIPTPPRPATKLTPLQASMRQKLISARFRHLNQTLYTTPSNESLSLISSNPEMFTEYHEGFRRQVEVWPENPVDGYISTLLSRGKTRAGPAKGKADSHGSEKSEQDVDRVLPIPRTNGTCTVADLGCGDATIATALQSHASRLHLKIHSFDLHSNTPLITKADVANLPLADSSVDVAIFCLALMGTNWIDFIEEAHRVLRWKGELWVAEIKSRFGRLGGSAGGGGRKVVEHSVGKRQKVDRKEVKKAKRTREQQLDDELAAVEVDGHPARGEETDVSAFVDVLRRRGFVLRGDGQPGRQHEGVELGNKMFVKMWFVKAGKPTKGKGAVAAPAGKEDATWKPKARGGFVDEEEQIKDEAGVLKPCVYKQR